MKTCYNCRHLYQCRLDYDRVYPCKDWTDDSKNQKTKPSDSTKANEGEEDNTAGRCTAGEKL